MLTRSRLQFVSALVSLSLMTLASARADTLYRATVLGTGDDYKPGYISTPDGHITGVTSQSGLIYAFDKTPVSFDESGRIGLGAHGAYELPNYASADGHKMYLRFDDHGNLPGPTFYFGGWIGAMHTIPVLDYNIHGQAVGTSNGWGAREYSGAVVSEPDFGFRDLYDTYPSNDSLNRFVLSDTPIDFTSAFKIDDLGRILAQGHEVGSQTDETFLLTPTELGDPATVPEPGAIWIAGMIVTAVGLRASARRRS